MSSGQQKDDSRQQPGSGKEHFAKKPFVKGQGAVGQEEGAKRGRAHIPSTVMTVEYIDDSEGMDAALRALEERMGKLETLLSSLQETYREMVSAINQQTKEIQEFVVSVSRRVDRLYRTVSGVSPGPEPKEPVEPQTPSPDVEEGLPQQFADDADHQEAWRIAKVLASDLEAYYPEKVREGALYGNFLELLDEQIEGARKTYEQRAPERVIQEYDHFSQAIEALLARKKRELETDASS